MIQMLGMVCMLCGAGGGCTTSIERPVQFVEMPIRHDTLCKLAWYVDEMNHAKFVSDSSEHLKDRLAMVGIETNGIWDVTYSATRGVLGIRGTAVSTNAIGLRMKMVNALVPDAAIVNYRSNRSGRIDYDPETASFGVLRAIQGPVQDESRPPACRSSPTNRRGDHGGSR